MDLQTATPVEIDTALAEISGKHYDVNFRLQERRDEMFRTAGAKRYYGRGDARWSMTFEDAVAKVREMAVVDPEKPWVAKEAQKVLDRRAELVAQRDAYAAEMETYNTEFRRRGGWTRAFLVTDGHVHSSQQCSTCNNGEYPTAFYWLTEFSGHTEAEVVEAAADRACTVCYPSAPVETAGASALMTPDERTRAQQREDAAKAKAERLAKRIEKGLTPDGSEFTVSHPGYNGRVATERFKTEQAATQWVVRYAVWGSHGTEDYTPAFDAIVTAIAEKHGQTEAEVREMLNAKAAKKAKAEGSPGAKIIL